MLFWSLRRVTNLYTTKRYVHLSDSYLMESMNAYWADREGGVSHETM